MPDRPAHSGGGALPAAEYAVPHPSPKGNDSGRTDGQRADQTTDHLHLSEAVSAGILVAPDGILDERTILRAGLCLQGAQ